MNDLWKRIRRNRWFAKNNHPSNKILLLIVVCAFVGGLFFLGVSSVFPKAPTPEYIARDVDMVFFPYAGETSYTSRCDEYRRNNNFEIKTMTYCNHGPDRQGPGLLVVFEPLPINIKN